MQIGAAHAASLVRNHGLDLFSEGGVRFLLGQGRRGEGDVDPLQHSLVDLLARLGEYIFEANPAELGGSQLTEGPKADVLVEALRAGPPAMLLVGF